MKNTILLKQAMAAAALAEAYEECAEDFNKEASFTKLLGKKTTGGAAGLAGDALEGIGGLGTRIKGLFRGGDAAADVADGAGELGWFGRQVEKLRGVQSGAMDDIAEMRKGLEGDDLARFDKQKGIIDDAAVYAGAGAGAYGFHDLLNKSYGSRGEARGKEEALQQYLQSVQDTRGRGGIGGYASNVFNALRGNGNASLKRHAMDYVPKMASFTEQDVVDALNEERQFGFQRGVADLLGQK